MRQSLAAALALLPAAALAQETRGAGAHEHGVGRVEIAAEGGRVEIDLRAPGMDIVGFEHEPESSGDMAAVADAVMQLARASEIVALDAAAGCDIVEVLAHRDVGEHAGDEHHGEDHAHEEDHAEEAGHSEFHARYVFACAAVPASVSFPYFERFAGARELEVAYVTESGAGAGEASPGAATLALD